MAAGVDPLRVVVAHPGMPRYRVPVFRELAARPGIELEVLYARQSNYANAEPDGFAARLVPEWRVGRGRATFMWHRAQFAGPGCDVLVLSWATRYLSLVPALALARRRGIGTVVWGHGYSKQEARWRSTLRAGVGRFADAVLFYSEPVAAEFRRKGWPPGRVFVAPNAIDQAPIRAARERWFADPGRLAAFSAEQRLAPGPVVLFVSRLHPANRLDVLVRAVGRLASRYPGLQVVIVGKGDDEAARISALAARLGIRERFRFLGPVYDEDELAPWFLSADLFCYPAAIGLSILHALGYGLPVVTSDLRQAQNPEIAALQDGVNGLLYRHDDDADLAAVMARAFDDDALRARLGEGALRTAATFDVPQMVDGMEAVIRAAATRRRASPRARI